MSARSRNNRRLKRRLWREVHGRALDVPVGCHWCGSPIGFDRATVDHVRPRSEGGGNGLPNVVIACDNCNQTRNTLNQTGEWEPI